MDNSREAIAEAMMLFAEEIDNQRKVIKEVIDRAANEHTPVHLINQDFQNERLLGSLQFALQAAGERLRNG